VIRRGNTPTRGFSISASPEAGHEGWRSGHELDFELETNETENDRSDLTDLFAAIEAASDTTLLENLSTIVDTERLIRFCALEAIVNQWDGFG